MPRLQPTEKQIEFAKILGIDIPEDASRGEVSDLISHAKRVRDQERAGLTHVPNEIADRYLRGTIVHSEERLKAAAAYVRSSGIRKSSIVERYETRYVVTGYARGCELFLRNMRL